MLSIGGEGVGADRQITRNSLGDEIANVNFRYDDIVHALQNTIESCIIPHKIYAVICWYTGLPNSMK